jgi:hypothetical protein
MHERTESALFCMKPKNQYETKEERTKGWIVATTSKQKIKNSNICLILNDMLWKAENRWQKKLLLGNHINLLKPPEC